MWFFSLAAWQQALLASLVMYLMTTLGAACVFFSKRPKQGALTILLGASAGIMIAASFFSLLLPAIEAEGALPAYLPAAAGFLLGGMFIIVSDLLLSRTQRTFHAIGDKRTALLYFAVTLHNIPEGMAGGVAFVAVEQRAVEVGGDELDHGASWKGRDEGGVGGEWFYFSTKWAGVQGALRGALFSGGPGGSLRGCLTRRPGAAGQGR